MFFYLAKALWFVLQPSTLIALLICYGSILIWTGWARWGRRFVTAGAILLLIAGLSPLGNALILPLEDRFARADLDAPPAPTGFILLGGVEDRLVGTARHAPSLGDAPDRRNVDAPTARTRAVVRHSAPHACRPHIPPLPRTAATRSAFADPNA